MFSFFKKKQKPAAEPLIVVPRIKHTNFIAALNSISGMTAESFPITEPLFGDLLLTYAIDIGPSYMSVSQSTLAEKNIQLHELRELATATALNFMRTLKMRNDGTVYELTADENMAACSLLFPELWQQISQEIGGPVAALFPHRDFVLYARADKPDSVAALNSVIPQIDFNETHALSKLIYRHTNGSWEAVGS